MPEDDKLCDIDNDIEYLDKLLRDLAVMKSYHCRFHSCSRCPFYNKTHYFCYFSSISCYVDGLVNRLELLNRQNEGTVKI